MPAARQALLAAYAELALGRRQRGFGVAAIIRAAKVARSTFYYHFADKDDLLLHNLLPLIDALGGMPCAREPSKELESWVAHIWEQRGAAGRILSGAAGRKIEAALVARLKEALKVGAPAARDRWKSPLQAEQIAGASLSLLRAWVDHRVTASVDEMAKTLWRGARSIAVGPGD